MKKVLRQLGFIETQMALFHSRKSGTTQGVQLITLSGAPDVQRLESGVRFLYDKYQALRCRIRETPDGMFFEEGVALTDVACRVGSSQRLQAADVNERVTQQLNAPLDQERALWSVEVLQDERAVYLMLKFHHSIIDGDGLSRVASVLLQHLDGKTPSNASAEPLAPPIDEALRALPQKAHPSGSVASHSASAPLRERRTRFRSVTFDARTSRALRGFALEHKLATNSVIAALVARAFRGVVALPDPIELKSAVSLREGVVQLSNPALLGCYIGVASSSLGTEGQSLAAVAKEYQQKLYQDVLYSAMRRSVVPYQSLREFIENIDATGHFPHGIGLTNLGDLKLPALEMFRVNAYVTLNNRNAGNVAVVTNALELAGQFQFTFVFCEPLMDAASVERVARKFEEQAQALSA